jgi:hypothetical protein
MQFCTVVVNIANPHVLAYSPPLAPAGLSLSATVQMVSVGQAEMTNSPAPFPGVG